MANKIRYGLSNTKYALYNPVTGEYDTPKDLKGAVSMTLTREGGDSSDFYADNGIYFTFAGTNGGYSADLEIARLTDEVRRDLFNEFVDSETGVQFETTNATQVQFALITEMLGDQYPIGFVFYNCVASRPEWNANTKGESPDVDTDTINIRMGSQEFTYQGSKQNFIQGHIEKDATNAENYAAFFEGVVIPTASGSSGASN